MRPHGILLGALRARRNLTSPLPAVLPLSMLPVKWSRLLLVEVAVGVMESSENERGVDVACGWDGDDCRKREWDSFEGG